MDFPLERDEGEYAYMGQLLLDGIPPYQFAGNHKFPGTYIGYAALMAVFGETTSGVHLGMLVVNLASTILLFCLGRRLFGSAGALSAAAAWVVMSVSPGVLGFAGHMTHFVVLPVLAGLLLLLRALDSGNRWTLAAAGACLGISVIVRQTSLVFVAFGGFVLLVNLLRKTGIRTLAERVGFFTVGSAIPVLLLVLWLYLAGVFPQFWRWTFTQALAYGSEVPLSDGVQSLWRNGAIVIGLNYLIWIGAALGLVLSIREWSICAVFLTGFLLSAFIAVCPGLYFREHYFVQILPAVALLFGQAIAMAWERPRNSVQEWRVGAGIAAGIALLVPILLQTRYFFELPPVQLAREIYGYNPFPETIEVARYINANSRPRDRVAVLGSEPQIFFHAQRRSATSLIYVYPLMENHRFAREMQENMAREIDAAAPEFIVFVNVPTSWLVRPDSDLTILKWAQQYLAKNYHLDGVVDILSPDSRCVYGPAARRYRHTSNLYLDLYRRNSTGVAARPFDASP